MAASSLVRRCLPSSRPAPLTSFLRFLSSAEDGGNKLSYFHNPGKEPLKQLTVGQLLDEAVRKWPERTAVISFHENKKLSFRNAQEQANQLASGFVKIGLKPGDRIGILCTNRVEFYITSMAAGMVGLILVNINPAFQKDELKYCLKKAEIKALISEEEFKTQKYYEMVCSIDPAIANNPSGSNFKCSSIPSFTSLIIITDKNLSGAWRFKDLLINPNEHTLNIQKYIQPDDAYNIQFSSGTTGKPKAALLSHFTLINNAYLYGKVNGFAGQHHTICLQVPLFHTFGISLGILGAMSHGATLAFPSPTFNAEASIETLKKERCSIIYGTPTMYIDLCNKIKQRSDDQVLQNNLKHFKVIISGGAVCTPQLFKLMSETLNCTNVASAYGMTETSPILMANTEHDTYEQRISTVGHVAEHAEVKVVDDNGKMVPFGQPGEAWFRGYFTMLGYWGEEEKTKETITPCRWIKTGDLFILHENGYGKVVGRKKDVIIRGGENIFPAEIENFLGGHPDILEVQAYGVTDKRMGEEVCVSVILQPKKTLTEESLRNYCKGKIAHFKIPRYIKFTNEFPKTASGKIQKYILRAEMENELKENEHI